MSVKQFLDYIKHEKQYSQHTCLAYERNLMDFSVFCQEHYDLKDIEKVDYSQIRTWIVTLVEKKKIPTELLIVKFLF
jgi:integrase/recombinase XerC